MVANTSVHVSLRTAIGVCRIAQRTRVSTDYDEDLTAPSERAHLQLSYLVSVAQGLILTPLREITVIKLTAGSLKLIKSGSIYDSLPPDCILAFYMVCHKVAEFCIASRWRDLSTWYLGITNVTSRLEESLN
ncbi:hypothetical protein ABW21_db0202997 [Orbilia brochopaga]|nr:hypothetical protein ABW21_db0202997 [Drechslerella brochopaga]